MSAHMLATPLSFPGAVEDVCDDSAGSLCSWVYDISDGNEFLASATTWFVDRPLRIIVVLVVAWIANRLLKRSVRKVVTHVITADRPEALLARLDGLGVPGADILEAEDDPRREARAKSISNVLGSTVSVIVWSIALMTALGIVGIDLGPLIAGAGIAGVALGFGAQSLVQDCIAGLFMLMEDQYGIGDVVDLGEAVGVVEEITLRATVLRSLNGTVWHVPNGQVQRVGNLSQLWSVAVVDVDVAYDTALAPARALIEQAVQEVCATEEFADKVLEAPTVLGVESLGADGITIRAIVKVEPGNQWAFQRAAREHIKVVFDANGIEIPFPQRTVWVRNEDSTG
ncbi:MAG: mechanosensitive ion channel family protein [Ilumatobacteraceae bacterium]